VKPTEISRGRLLVNATGCAVIAALCLPGALWCAIELGSMQAPPPNDPDGPKAAGVIIFGMVLFGLFGIAALIDLLRSIRRIRRAPAD
jgi:hypothetical protein